MEWTYLGKVGYVASRTTPCRAELSPTVVIAAMDAGGVENAMGSTANDDGSLNGFQGSVASAWRYAAKVSAVNRSQLNFSARAIACAESSLRRPGSR